jgi:hypothetical protein
MKGKTNFYFHSKQQFASTYKLQSENELPEGSWIGPNGILPMYSGVLGIPNS